MYLILGGLGFYIGAKSGLWPISQTDCLTRGISLTHLSFSWCQIDSETAENISEIVLRPSPIHSSSYKPISLTPTSCLRFPSDCHDVVPFSGRLRDCDGIEDGSLQVAPQLLSSRSVVAKFVRASATATKRGWGEGRIGRLFTTSRYPVAPDFGHWTMLVV